MSKPLEADLEGFVCDHLVAHGGYTEWKHGTAQTLPRDFDTVAGIDTAELMAFIGATQADPWDKLVKVHGGDPNHAQAKFVDRLAKELDGRGTVDVLRRGIVDQGITIQLAYFRPAHGHNPLLAERYAANRLTVTRQLPYEAGSNKTLDMVLFANGLPVATVELKNPLTGQTVDDAKHQYRHDRDPKNRTLGRRAVVHFAVDTETAAMTTRLEGPDTRFLPFNLGDDRGAGNPANPNGHRTAYLWERVWQRDVWLDILGRFVHVEQTGKGSRSAGLTIFPRFHQWDAVLRLEAAAREEGAGQKYLVQHSAGSGKSNSIAWLAHRLSSLHNSADEKVFDKVIVVTDRVILNKQLQDTIYQFDHVHGVVQKIDENSQQLADALAGEQARVIITTLQKFPFVLDKVGELPARRYAVIIDEAHSSQTGEAAKEMKKVLGAPFEAKGTGDDDEPPDAVEEALAAQVKARGVQPNLSLFAFTATPKGRTLELFGRKNPTSGKHEAFHLYSMRQAIEEGFILDVLSNYVTYKTYWEIEKKIADDPEFDSAKARAAIARFVALHEVNLAQKAEVIVEHFRTHVRHKIGGRAKAMVVASSRLHAVRYKLALDKYVNDKGYGDVGILVAFSGTIDDEGAEYTESKMNGFPDTQTAVEFDGDEWQFLVVAEKYQTGFDQPLLYAMYVDKVLTGLGAVQTLSRLNRTHPLKDGTFVLDFRNEAEAVRDAFEPWFGSTVAPPTDPNLLYDTRHALDEFGILWPDEVEKCVAALLLPGEHNNTERVHAALAPAIDRFRQNLDDDEQARFRDALDRFIRVYAFLSQIVTFGDTKLERDYLFGKALAMFIRPPSAGGLDLGDAVELSHLRVEKTFEGSVALDVTGGEVTTITSGTGPGKDPIEEPLSVIIDRLNEKFGTNWAPEDRLFFDTVAAKLAGRADVQQAAAANTPENFGIFLGEEFMKAVVEQMGVAEDMTLKYVDNADLQTMVLAAYQPLIQSKAKVAHQEHCPIGELLGPPPKESQWIEYKATLRTHDTDGEIDKLLEVPVLKTIAAFLNSYDGGTLLIGVTDTGEVHGLDADYASLHKDGKDDADLFQLHLGQIVRKSMGEAAATNMTVQVHHVDGHDICRVHVRASGYPVDAAVTRVNKGQHETKTAFYVRTGNGTHEFTDPDEKAKYTATRWG
ncbi:MAG: putative DNA binding domain-containing protein [Acidimicrobiales bacterium]